MNSVQRRLFRVFVEAGGDMTNGQQVERFIHLIDVQVTLMPPRVRKSMELVLRASDNVRYAELAAELGGQEGASVTPTALRQRVARGMRILVDRVQRRQPGPPGEQASGSGQLETRPVQ
jgi:hypothetical protein